MPSPQRSILLACFVAVLWLPAIFASSALAAEPETTESVAEKLSAATVTVRTIPARLAGNYLSNNSALVNPANDGAAAAKSPDNKEQPGKDASPTERNTTRRQADPKRNDPAAPAANETNPANNPSAGNYTNANSNLLSNLTYNTANPGNDNSDAVTICSGVAVGKGLIVTFGGGASSAAIAGLGNPNGNPISNSGNNSGNNTSAPAANPAALQTSRYRVTLPDGQQAKATLRVVDHYSGLSLLELEDLSLPALELSTEAPRVGSTVMSAAGSGIERPVVSRGIVSSVDRSLPGSEFPPLLQCDLHTTETSSGAALVDQEGKLVGIIVATSATGSASGWTFAVPARHVKRLLDAAAAGRTRIAKDNAGEASSVKVLERRRPSVGLTLGPGVKEGTVEVEHVISGGAADRAGIQKGDLVLEAEGRKIRSAYQAVEVVLNRQPGEKIELAVQRGDERKVVQVQLESAADNGAAQQQGNYDNSQAQVGPQISVRRDSLTNQIEIRNARGNDFNGGVTQRSGNYGPQQTRSTVNDDAATLRARLTTLEREAARLQQELLRRDQRFAEAEAEREALREEVTRLKKQLEAGRK